MPAERSLHRTIKDFEVVDGEERCAGALLATQRAVLRGLRVKSEPLFLLRRLFDHRDDLLGMRHEHDVARLTQEEFHG